MISCDAFELLVLLRKFIYTEDFLNEIQAFHMSCSYVHIIIPHVLAATNMKWIEAKMKVSVRKQSN